jgi:hypothetical protein
MTSRRSTPEREDAEQELERYPRVALRWHGRWCAERVVTLSEAQAALALLALAQHEPAAVAALREIARR